MPNPVVLLGADQLTRTLRALADRAPARAAGALYREAERIMTRSKQEFVPVDLGALRASGQVHQPVIGVTSISVILGYGDAAAGYAVYVHEGTGPAVGRPAFMPPVDVIREWALRHGLPEEAAFPIARAIGQRGLAPLKYLERPLLEAVRGMDARLAADIRGEVERAAR